jgi:hypothetical protein
MQSSLLFRLTFASINILSAIFDITQKPNPHPVTLNYQ